MRAVLKQILPDVILKSYRSYQQSKKIKSYQGDKVICPLCNSRFKMFAPYGVIQRQNAKCINCGSLERHRLQFLYLTKKTNLFNNGSKLRLLHFAPEKPFYDIFTQNQNIEYTPCDLFPDLYNAKLKGSIKVEKVDITSIPFDENYFDVILCSHVLEHIPDDRAAMAELYRVMKRGGWGIIQVPIDYSRKETYEDFSITAPQEREKAFGQHDHVRVYGSDYKDRLCSVGFQVKEDDFVRSISAEDIARYGLQPEELIYYCNK